MICEIHVTRGIELYDETVQELFNLVYKEASKGNDGNFTAFW